MMELFNGQSRTTSLTSLTWNLSYISGGWSMIYGIRWNFLRGSRGQRFNLHGKSICVLSTGRKEVDHDHNERIPNWLYFEGFEIFCYLHQCLVDIYGIWLDIYKQFCTFGILQAPHCNETEQQQNFAQICCRIWR